jgi:hypothetical protein
MKFVISAVRVVEAVTRIPMAYDVTFFSKEDRWQYEAVMDDRTCPACNEMDYAGTFTGNHLRRSFPYLEITDADRIKANVHPNCRCYLVRMRDTG